MDEKVKLLAQSVGTHRIKFNENLIYHTASSLNALAKYFYIATTKKELVQVLDALLDLRIPFLILGSGTKTLPKNIKDDFLVIKNRTSGLKVGAVKGKVGREGIGVEEAMIEVDSGVSLIKLNEFLVAQKLQVLGNLLFPQATVGGSIFNEHDLKSKVEQVEIWEEGDIFSISADSLKSDQVILSTILKIKA